MPAVDQWGDELHLTRVAASSAAVSGDLLRDITVDEWQAGSTSRH